MAHFLSFSRAARRSEIFSAAMSSPASFLLASSISALDNVPLPSLSSCLKAFRSTNSLRKRIDREVVLGTVSLPGRKTASWWRIRNSLNPWEKECSVRLSRLGTVSLPERKNASWGRTGNSLNPSEKEWTVRSYWEQFKSLRERMDREVVLGTV